MVCLDIKHQIHPWVTECIFITFCRLSIFHALRCNAAQRPRKSERKTARHSCFAPVDSRRCGLILPVARLIATQARRVGLRASSGWTAPSRSGAKSTRLHINKVHGGEAYIGGLA
ncbi:unnamed protein product [Fusarium venenatum]|uniref:Uncharacterized protein n=1 Tax=Fusarium venenatum TaxID=56646 RepID=A0A2L2TKV4_9HYPO|nr:uncharacterized protein FVRRES_01649 [Fusarium venenatum]CEI65137.1 unnamed protein product [Fusarium venenatum]